MTVSTKEEAFHRVSAALDRANDQSLSGFLERDHVGAMRDTLKNSGKEQTFHSESVAREHSNNTGRRFFDLIEVDIAERSLRACAALGIKRYGPDLAHIRSERERLLREQAEMEDMQFEHAMTYACQMMQRRISTTAKENAIVEEKVATAEGSMTNRIMLTEFHKSHDVATKLVSNDNTGVLEPKKTAQDIWKEDLKRAAIQERKSRENGAQALRCNREELKVLALKERRNRESIAEAIKHQSTPQVDSEASSREELKRRALEERRMREHDRRNLAGAPLMHVRHQHRGNEKKANVGEARASKERTSSSSTGPSLGTKQMLGLRVRKQMMMQPLKRRRH